MTTTANEPVQVDLRHDGTGEVVVGGRVQPIVTRSLAEARERALAAVQLIAADRGAPVRFTTTDPDGGWQLVMSPSGDITEDAAPGGEVGTGPSESARPLADPAPASRPTPPAPSRPAVSGAALAPPPTPTPPAPPGYDSDYVLHRIVPVTRIPKATKGWRALLGLGPSKAEQAERRDRAAICTPFGRPVTIVVADPRGGVGKTTTSLLLAGAFGTGRGGGVLALENHELRGTMHLRTDSGASSSTIRDLLAAQSGPDLAPDTVRAGDLARYVRHQTAGQYDVLVSATKTGRALRRAEFDRVHALVGRMYWVIIVDTANNESAENWQAACAKADALVVPVKWRNDYTVPAIEMLEELQAGGPSMRNLVAHAVVVASHGEGEVDSRCRTHLLPYFRQRTQAVIEIPPDRHIAEGNAILHDQLAARTRRLAERMAAEAAQAVQRRMAWLAEQDAPGRAAH